MKLNDLPHDTLKIINKPVTTSSSWGYVIAAFDQGVSLAAIIAT